MDHPYILKNIFQRMAELGHKDFHFESVRVTVKEAIEPTNEVFYNFTGIGVIAGGPPGIICSPSFVPPPVPVFSPTKFYLLAHNVFYFLVEKNIDPKLRIKSDTGCLTSVEAANYNSYTFFNFKEFTGQIFFDQDTPAPIDLEFIRCTPYTNN